jgi:hypothetical protein
MSIVFAKPPAKSKKALQKGLIRHRATLEAGLRDSQPAVGNNSFLLPHAVYFARLDHVKAGVGLRYARPVAWRYFVKSAASESLVLAEINIEPKGTHRFASLHMISHGRDHYELLKSIAREANDRGAYAFRLLRIPSIYVLAVWLRSERRGHDIIVPLAPNHHFLTNQRFYSRREFEELIQSEARDRAESSLDSN